MVAGSRSGFASISLDHGQFSSYPLATESIALASEILSAKTVTQSKDAQAGTTPLVDHAPIGGLYPTRLFNIAGTLPDPAVSVPKAKVAKPSATLTEEPDEEPPDIILGSNALQHSPYGLLVPTRPVAN